MINNNKHCTKHPKSYVYVNNTDMLSSAAKEWKAAKEIGVDLECENNLHHYGMKVSLIQISTPNKDWIVDAIVVGNLTPLLDIFEDRNIQKIFHDVSFDLRIILKEFSCRPKNIYDTQLALMLLGKKELGLSELLSNYFGVEKKHKFQKADWTKRPISDEMLSYATNDTRYLIRLRDILNTELEKLGRLQWMKEECTEIENKDFSYPEPDFFSIKGIKFISDKERAIAFRLYNLRENLAKIVDRPVHFVINSRTLLLLSGNSPKTVDGWANLRGVHPIVKSRAKLFFDEVNKGRNEQLRIPYRQKMRYTFEQREKIAALTEKRNHVAEKLCIPGHLILNNDQMQKIVLTGSICSLKPWQKLLLGV